MRDERDRQEQDRGPEEIFRALKDRPTPELDSGAVWTRLQARLEKPPQGLAARIRDFFVGEGQPGWRWAPVGLAALVMAVSWWMLPPQPVGDGAVVDLPDPPAAASRSEAENTGADEALVLLADAGDEAVAESAAEAPTPTMSMALDARLVRGYDGAMPADALPAAALGAGGADPLADLRATLAGVVPTSEYALVGRWRGEIDAEGTDAAEATVSDRYRLSYRVERTATGLRLLDVRLLGEGTPLIADAIDLEPGRLYVFGAGGADPDLVLALRLTATGPATAPGVEPGDARQE